MNDLVTDVKSLELETLKNLKSSKSNNTLRAYKADFKDFALFCQQNGLKSMPSDAKIITLYLTHLSKSSKFSTLKRRLASISVIHKLNGHYLDTKHPIITENLLGAVRVVLGPLIGFALIKFLGLTGFMAGVLLIQSAMPSAVLTYLVGSMYSKKRAVDNIASVIVSSTLMSFITIPIVVYLSLRFFN